MSVTTGAASVQTSSTTEAPRLRRSTRLAVKNNRRLTLKVSSMDDENARLPYSATESGDQTLSASEGIVGQVKEESRDLNDSTSEANEILCEPKQNSAADLKDDIAFNCSYDHGSDSECETMEWVSTSPPAPVHRISKMERLLAVEISEEELEKELRKYNPLMVRRFAGVEKRTAEQSKFRQKNTEASRRSRAIARLCYQKAVEQNEERDLALREFEDQNELMLRLVALASMMGAGLAVRTAILKTLANLKQDPQQQE